MLFRKVSTPINKMHFVFAVLFGGFALYATGLVFLASLKTLALTMTRLALVVVSAGAAYWNYRGAFQSQ